MRAVLTVIGKDHVGILSKVANQCAESNANIIEVTQTVLQDLFCMIMMIDISECQLRDSPSCALPDEPASARNPGLPIHVMHEDIFNSMHRI